MSSKALRTILLTGGSGVLGDALLAQLAGRYQTICLKSKSPLRQSSPEVICGDITKPFLGLDQREYGRLAERLDWIIHSAAVTHLDGAPAKTQAVNVAGTANIIELARASKAPLYHISTAFAGQCDYYDGVPPATPYETSKINAELLVHQSGVQASVFRPSIIVGDSLTGYMPSFQGFHTTLGLLMQGVLPVMPCPAEAYVDVIPRDVAARAIVTALDMQLSGREYSITSGQAAITLRTLLDLLEQRAPEGSMFKRPRCLHPDVFERLIRPVFLPSMPAALRPVLLKASSMCRYVSLRSPLKSSLAEILHHKDMIQRDVRQELARTIDFIRPKIPMLLRMLKLSDRTQEGGLSIAMGGA